MVKKEKQENEEQAQVDSRESMDVEIKTIYDTPLIEDVVGKAREFIDDFRKFSENEALYNTMGTEAPSVFLLEGYPGTGKSMAINALNNSINIEGIGEGRFSGIEDLSLLVLPYSIGKYGTAYINMSSKIIQKFFDCAYFHAENERKVLIEIDECDSLLLSRTSSRGSHSENNKTLETLMKNLQISGDTPNLYVAMMTNTPEICDQASLRAKRVHKKYTFDLPNYEERVIGFKAAIDQVNSKALYSVIRGARLEILAEISKGFNYSDIFQSVDSAVHKRIDTLLVKKGTNKKTVNKPFLRHPTLEKVVKKHKQSFHPDRRRPSFLK